MLSVQRLRALTAVRRLGSVAGAAAELHATPSGVSQQLAKLAQEAGHELLEPRGRGVRLTQAGLVLADHAERVLAQVAAAELDLADLHTEILGPLRIGALQSAIRGLVAPALATLLDRHPRLSPSLTDGEAIDLMPLLLSGDLDLVVAESWENRPAPPPAGIRHARLLTEDAWLALSERHRLADAEVVDLAALAGTAWTSCAAGTDDREALVAGLRAAGVEPEITCEASDYLTQLVLVAANVVAAMVPPLGFSYHVPDGVRLLATRPALRRELYVAWRADAERPAIRAAVTALREAVPASSAFPGSTGPSSTGPSSTGH